VKCSVLIIVFTRPVFLGSYNDGVYPEDSSHLTTSTSYIFEIRNSNFVIRYIKLISAIIGNSYGLLLWWFLSENHDNNGI